MDALIQELETLLLDWEADSLDESGLARLREILRTDAAARKHFAQLQMMTTALHLEGDAGLAHSDSNDQQQATVFSRSTLSGSDRKPRKWTDRLARRLARGNAGIIAVLSLLVVVMSGWILATQFQDLPGQVAQNELPRPHRNAEEETARGIALVTRLVDVSWSDEQSPVEVGEALTPGRFAIESGHAQVEFFCGATVIIEGPADLELVSPMLANVREGRLRAHVPPAARGFSLQVDDMTVVDLGTEFGLSVSEGSTDVQVFDGEVELHGAKQNGAEQTKQRITAGQALRRQQGGDYQPTTVDPERYVGIADLESRAEQQRSAHFERWKAWSEELRQDPRLIAYYSFDQAGDWERRLASSLEPANPELDGAIVGANELQGRWQAKRALEFKQPADRVRVQIPGEYKSLSFACWVKIDSLDRWYNSLFLTDGYDQGEPHWQILDNGRIYFSVRPNERKAKQGPRDFKALSPSFWRPSMNGKWIHLAVTCDLENNTIVHYVNGEVLSRHQVPAKQMPEATRIGTASLGNWAAPTQPDTEFAIRNLNGCIDEFAIFATALTAEEIEEMYEYGKP